MTNRATAPSGRLFGIGPASPPDENARLVSARRLSHLSPPSRSRSSPWRRLWIALAGVLLLGLSLLMGTLALALDRSPAFSPTQRISPAAAGEAARWLKQLDPRSLSPLEWMLGRHAVSAAPAPVLPAAALQALVQDLAQRLLRVAGRGASSRSALGGAALQLGEGQAQLGLSLPLAAMPLPRWLPASMLPEAWLNFRATWQAQPEGLPQLQALSVGALPLPVTGWARDLALRGLAGHQHLQRLQMAAQAVQRVELSPAGLSLQLYPPLEMAERLRRQVLPDVDMAALQRHHARLAQVLQQPELPPKGALPLSTLLGPLLAYAQSQAHLPAHDASMPMHAGLTPHTRGTGKVAQHNRLALLAVTLYAFKLEPRWLAPQLDWPALPQRDITLRGRHDHALHYLLSATLVMGANRALADALGLYKELADAGDPRSSGFSFDDIAADKAGTALGQRALLEPHKLAQLLPLMIDDVFLMPAVDGLPTGLNAAQFQQQFGDVDSPRFAAQMAEVERRVQALPLLAR